MHDMEDLEQCLSYVAEWGDRRAEAPCPITRAVIVVLGRAMAGSSEALAAMEADGEPLPASQLQSLARLWMDAAASCGRIDRQVSERCHRIGMALAAKSAPSGVAR